jgi:CRP/FNR family cyclic AMP-dependent transcriptional regulator
MENPSQSKIAASNSGRINQTELECLSQCFLFADLPPKSVSAALKDCQCLRLPEKKEIYRRGESGEEMCVVLSGGVKVSTLSADGKEIIFDLLSAGDFFGELSLLDGGPRTATVTTLVPSVLAIINRSFLIPFLENNPTIAIRLLHILANRLRTVDTFLEEVLFFDSETRLAKRVIALKDIYGKAVEDTIQIELNVSQQDMANLVGITRERVNKHLKKWERAGIVSLQQRRLTIQNLPHLHELAGKVGSLSLLKV